MQSKYAKIQTVQQKLVDAGYDVYAQILSNYFLKNTESETRMIGVVGDDLVGKSSVINTLLNEKILPTSVIPSTADITIRYRDTNGVFADGCCENLEDLENLTDEKTNVEIFSNNNFLHSASLILKEYHGIINNKIATDILSLSPIYECDKVIFVISAEHLLSEAECLFISNYIRYCGEDHILLVINKVDLLNPADIDATLDYAQNQIANKFGKVKWMVLDETRIISNCNLGKSNLKTSVLKLLENGYSQTINAEYNLLHYMKSRLKEEILLFEKYRKSSIAEIDQANQKISEQKSLAKAALENALLDFKQRKNIAQETTINFLKDQFNTIISHLISEFEKASNKYSWYETNMNICWNQEISATSALLAQRVDDIITKDVNYLNEVLKTQIGWDSMPFEMSNTEIKDNRKVVPYGKYKKYALIGTGGLVIAGYCLFSIIGALTGLGGGALAYAYVTMKDASQIEELKQLMTSNMFDVSQTTRKIVGENLEKIYLSLLSKFEEEATMIIDLQYQPIKQDNSTYTHKIEIIQDIVAHIEEMS